MDIHYQNQKNFCEKHRVPFFSSASCSHTSKWMQERPEYHKLQTLGDMLVEIHGEDEAFKISSGTHITGCPTCGRSWCD